MFLIHNLEEEYSPYASLHSKVIGGVNTCLLIVTIWVFFFGVQTLWPESFMWELLENADTVWGNLPSWNNNCLFELFVPLLFSLMWSRLKSKDKFMTRERIAKQCLSFMALFPRLKQGHYTLCRRRCMQSVPWKNWESSDQEEFTPVLQWIVPLQGKSLGKHNSSYYHQKNLPACLLYK